MDDKWLDLRRLDLSVIRSIGVYIIWHGGPNPRIVRVGQGDIAQRLFEHRGNSQILRYAQEGDLFVTWAEIGDQAQRDGVETYLAQQYSPLLGDNYPQVPPLAVGSPFG